MTLMKPLLIVLAGPNGAGKSTFYEAFLSHLDLPFLNADTLAYKMGLEAYESADQIANIRDELIKQQQGLILETVLSDPVGDKINVFHAAAQANSQTQSVGLSVLTGALTGARAGIDIDAGLKGLSAAKTAVAGAQTSTGLQKDIQDLRQQLARIQANRARYSANFLQNTPQMFMIGNVLGPIEQQRQRSIFGGVA